MSVSVSPERFSYFDAHFYRTNASHLEIGNFGIKTGTWGYVERYRTLETSELDLHDVNIPEIDWHRDVSFSGDAEAKVNVVGTDAAGGAVEFDFGKMREGTLALVSVAAFTGDLEELIEGNEWIFKFFQENKKARVVSRVWKVVDAELASELRAGGRVEANVNGLNPAGAGIPALEAVVSADVGAGAGGNVVSQKRVVLGAGSTFAYMLTKPVFNRGRNEIKYMADDEIGPFR